jgi:hypothetical protein
MRTKTGSKLTERTFICGISLKTLFFKFLVLGIHVLTFSWKLESLQIITRLHKPEPG